MSELIMIRHGQASFGEKDYDRLSPAGINQAKLLARHLLNTKQAFDAVYCGTMERQKNTAKELIECFSNARIPVPDPVISADFDEYDSFSVWNSLVKPMLKEKPDLSEAIKTAHTDKKSFQKVFEAVMFRWVAGEYDLKGVPSWEDFKKRVKNGISKIMETHGSGRKIIVFTSGGPVSAAVQHALGLSDLKTIELSWQVLNSSVTRFKYSSKGIILSGFNDISHIEKENDGTLITYR
ncbi:MAG: histidine phosphatase family protein [Desulfobacteraceae bacterium]|nr:MAG: histidine phosphatase family protein [Desulfobacteraceae bacterium]